MKLLVISMDSVGEGLGIALKAAKAGHDVRLWLAKQNHPDTGRGFGEIAIVPHWITQAKWADLILPTGNHEFIAKLDMLRKAGAMVWGPSKKSADLEIKRSFGMEFFKSHGIQVPDWKQFSSLAEAEQHVRKTEQRFCFKTLGDEEDKSLSYVGKTPADLIARLQRWQEKGMTLKGPCMLQEVIDGQEIGVSRWLGREGWVGPPNENFEHKKLLSGNCGPNCGEAGTVMKYCANKSSLFEQVLAPLEEALIAMGHTGDIDVNCIVDESGKAWPLEFTTRLGWPAANIMWASHRGDPVQWMLDALNGKDTLEVSTKVYCGVVLAQPDYPYSDRPKEDAAGIPIYGVTNQNKAFLFPQEVCQDDHPDMKGTEVVEREIWSTTGDYVLVATGSGATIRQARTRAYDLISELHFPDMMFRDDIGEKLEDELPKLQKHGIATEFRYE